MEVYKKLIGVQLELKAPKNQFNSFGKYNYRSCEDILEALKPLLDKHKATIFINDSMEQVNDRYYVKATVVFVDIETGENVTTSAFAREEEAKKGMDSSQITGSASSYARKYALNGMFCIDDTKDSDFTNTHDKGNKAGNDLSEAQIKRLYAKANAINVTPAQVLETCKKSYGITDVKQLSKKQYDEICNRLDKKASAEA